MFKLNNTPFPAPSELKWTREPLGSFVRNANGDLIGDLIAVKRKLTVRWAVLPSADVAKLLQTLETPFVLVTFPNPQTGAQTTMDSLVSPHGGDLAYTDGLGNWWRNVTVTLTER